jgi:hypothetical protein
MTAADEKATLRSDSANSSQKVRVPPHMLVGEEYCRDLYWPCGQHARSGGIPRRRPCAEAGTSERLVVPQAWCIPSTVPAPRSASIGGVSGKGI